jgi:ABC-type antimicrobial peptide transport system permease subunit
MAMSLSQGWNGQHGGAPMIVNAIQVGASYFKLLRIPVLAGSGFTETDFRKKTGSVIVNESFARRYFPRENVIGKRVGDWHVVAVVKDVRSSFRNAPAPILYLPFNGGFGPYFGILIRTAHPVPALARQVAAAITRQNPSAGTVSLSSLDDLIAKDASGMRTSLELFGALAAVALLLGLCGIYSVVAYGTERRFHEIGIRLAVGARPWNIISLIIGDALVQGAIGVVAGLVLCGLTMQLLASQLYKTSPLDPPSLAAVIALIIACTGCASAIPAFRAAFARPSATLRYE